MDAESTQNSTPQETPEPHSELAYNTIANKLTAVRIALVPVVVALLFDDSPFMGFLAAIFFGIAAITDYFDGYYARTRKAITVIGQLLDPLADKFLVVSSLVMLMHLGRIHPAIVIVLICREMAITGLRAIASAEGIVIAASQLAKWKTATQMAAIPMLMLHEDYFHVPLQMIGTVLIGISLLISVWSAKDYIVDFFKTYAKMSKERRSEKKAKRLAKRGARLKRFLEKNPDLAKEIKDAQSQPADASDE